MGGRGSASGGVKQRRGGKNKGKTRGEKGTPRGDEQPSLPKQPKEKPLAAA
jgi:hypothetical protein